MNVNGTLAPGATGVERASGAAPARDAAVPLKIVVVPLVITKSSFEQKSVADPLSAPFVDWVHVAPGVKVKELAGTVPAFLMVTEVTTGTPGTMVVLPPNLLMVEQVEELVDTVPPSVDVQVTVPAALVSCMTRTPDAAEFVLFVILAANPASEPDKVVNDSAATANPDTRVKGATFRLILRRRREDRTTISFD